MASKILICMGTSGVSAGAKDVERLFREGLEKHGLTGQYTIIRTGDRGLFRDVLVDIVTPGEERVTYEFLKPENVEEIVEDHLVGGEPVDEFLAEEDYEQFFEGQTRILLANCGEIDPESIDDYIATGGYEGARKILEWDPERVLQEVCDSGLRGRGGAGFPTGQKWRFGRNAKSDTKYMVCNADEGDPGAFMDRSLLEGDPHALVEGLVLAGYAVGASEGYIYCRAEYPLAIKRLKIALDQARERGFLGQNILGTDFAFDITIKEGAGAFVCGEETALLASIEGRRGMPNPRPPFPTDEGLWGESTVINNVETIANIRHIIMRGADWFAGIGTEGNHGTKVFALAGTVRNTGLVEVPMGTTIRDLIFGPGGGMSNPRINIKAVQLGGPSGGCIPESLLDTPIDYESITQTGAIMGSGGMVVMDERTCMVDVAKFFLDFTVEESCGKCVPCRIGLKRMHEVLEEITAGRGKPEHLVFLKEMGNTVRSTALCGLGNTAPNPVITSMRYFEDEYRVHIENKACPAHVCAAMLEFEIIEDRCTKCGACATACPANAITWERRQYPKLDKDKCTQCKSCINACGYMAIR